MPLVNRYDRVRFGIKFRRYKIFFFISYCLFVLSFIGEIFLYGAGGNGAVFQGVELLDFFAPLATAEAFLYLLTFLLGITVYAPAFNFFCSVLRGAFSGYVISCIFHSLNGKESVLLLLLGGAYLFLSACLSCSYASFCSMVSLRIYTDRTLRNVKEEEKRMFGGTLFNSTFFCNTINLRFLSTYTILYFTVFFFSVLLCLVYAFFRSLLY